MKKSIFPFSFFLFLMTLSHLCYSSFPITSNTNLDTLNDDQIKAYHASLIDMGIDVSSCKCVSCRKNINNSQSYFFNEEKRRVNYIKLILILYLIAFLLGLWLIYVLKNNGWFNSSGGMF